MAKDQGLPPRAEENRATVQARLAESAAGGGTRETFTVEWRGKPEHLEVIEMEVGDLYYNPATHRIRAQAGHDPEKSAVLQAEPWSAESQTYLGRLLQVVPHDPARTDPEFDELSASLKEFGQTDPGLITHEGILVNGNTRRAALLELHGPTHPMRVAVLPPSCDWRDIAAIELSLQLRKEHRRDYSYINRLLAVEELVEQGTPLAAIAATFRTTAARVRQDQWVLSLIRQLVKRSETSGEWLSLVAFEEQAEKFRELQRAYEKQYSANPERADLLVENRLAAMLLGFAKTDVRFIDAKFHEAYLSKTLPEGAVATPAAAQEGVAIPGLGRAVQGPSPAVAAARALTDTVLHARAITQAGSSASAESIATMQTGLMRMHTAMDEAITDAGRDARIAKRKQASPARLADANRSIEQCITDLVLSRSQRSLDEEAFDDAIVELRKRLEKLAIEARRTVGEPGDGLSWLLEATGKAR
ncbi:transcriptional regulator [Streptomyces sp. SID7815]|uniref:ParB domain protein nuclease n=1 Tax=Streptomyces pratensis (strain ATCC 33331 / IAF-45CD) TaxID=591167 RepID=A0A8D3WG12_STRFA|nr:transcriptional regulator [Streptomyces sp. SID7815]MYT51777.1 transcriptional regulator [Streptomyces sp. SID7815]